MTITEKTNKTETTIRDVADVYASVLATIVELKRIGVDVPMSLHRAAQSRCTLPLPGFITPSQHFVSTISPTTSTCPTSLAGSRAPSTGPPSRIDAGYCVQTITGHASALAVRQPHAGDHFRRPRAPTLPRWSACPGSGLRSNMSSRLCCG